MAATERITMTMRELDRFKVIQDVADGKLKPWRAAERLELTTRQIRRLVGRLREHGPQGLVSRRRAKPSNNRLDAVTADRALSIIRDRYADFGPTLACEKLWECHGICLAKETVRRLMTDAGMWVPRRQRPPKVYQPRARRACLGELIQIDGSEHRWFEERAPQCTLLVYVDDATSRLMMLHFTQRRTETHAGPRPIATTLRIPCSFIQDRRTRRLAHDADAAVDEYGVSSNTPCIRCGEIGAAETDIHDVDQFAERRPLNRFVEQ